MRVCVCARRLTIRSEIWRGKKKRCNLNKPSHNKHLLLKKLMGLNGNWLWREEYNCLRVYSPGPHAPADGIIIMHREQRGTFARFSRTLLPHKSHQCRPMTGRAPDFINVPPICVLACRPTCTFMQRQQNSANFKCALFFQEKRNRHINGMTKTFMCWHVCASVCSAVGLHVRARLSCAFAAACSLWGEKRQEHCAQGWVFMSCLYSELAAVHRVLLRVWAASARWVHNK